MNKRTNSATWSAREKRWKINVQMDGKRRTFTSGIAGRNGQRACNAKADAWLDQGIDKTGSRIEELMRDWLDGVKATTSLSNWRPMESRIRIHVLPFIGTKRIDRVTEGDLQELVDSAYADGMSKKSLKNICSDIQAFFKWARLHKYTVLRPEQLHVPAGASAATRTVLQPDDLRKLFQSDKTIHFKKEIVDPLINAYRFNAASGMRPGELQGLRWSDIDGFCGDDTDWDSLSGRRICIARAINIYGQVTDGKNENARRAIVIYPLLVDFLKDQYKLTGNDDCVFGISSGRVYYEALKRYCKHNGISQVSPYELRHTFVSIAKTLPTGEVKELVGHSRNMDTFGVYSHEIDGDAKRVSDDLDQLYEKLLK